MQPSLLAPEPAWLPELLAALSEYEVLSKPQMAALLQRDRTELDPVLATLVAKGQVGKLVGDVARETGHRLTRKGVRLLAELTGNEPGPLPAIRATTMLGHELLKNDLAVVLRLLHAASVVDVLRWVTARDQLADAVRVLRGDRSERIALVADAFVAIRTPSGPTALLVEIDMNTVSLVRMMKRYEGYAAWWRGGGPERRFGVRSLRVLTITNHPQRLARLREAAAEVADSGSHGLFWFATGDVLDLARPERFLEAQFVTAAPDATARGLLN